MQGHAREDGLFDLEAHLTDTKPFDFQVTAGPLRPAGEPIHEMWIRLTLDANLQVHAAEAATDHAPYAACLGAPESLQSLVGLRIGAGWNKALRERLGGTRSCTHLMEMLVPMATAAIQSVVYRFPKSPPAPPAVEKPPQVDACRALAADGPVVAVRWPGHYTGPRR
jgi:hypothetical protein